MQLYLWPALAAALGLALAGPAPAQQSPQVCQTLFETATAALPGLSGTVTAEGAACVVTDATLMQDDVMQISVERMTLEGQGLDALASDLTPPSALDLTVSGLRFVAVTGDPVLDYLLAAQARPSGIDARLTTRWDALTRRFSLSEGRVDFAGGDYIRLTGTAGGVDFTSLSTAQISMGSVTLQSLSLDLRSHGLFESMALLPLGSALLAGSADPAAEVDRLKARATDQVAALPEAIFPAQSREALTRLIAQMPNPRGRLTVDVTAPDPGFGFAGLMLYGVQGPGGDLWSLFDGVRVVAAYQPGPAE